ncbi:hypothetical protein C8R27_1702 [Nitrosomonas ureae]|uniref:hypothetical protein n=1 Tax=Nitrosomonas ureae TaxID=44577 RepID=UPI000D765958|nr:hypothetical protein [Nitrosomonas ureae]PXX05953.1 hypothetical protein C8R27_1702 [Nitrosomonas ureae]
MPYLNNRLWGAFQDISPDRWGRLIQTRAVGISLSDSDYMLGVSDYMRMGGLRLSHSHTPGVAPFERTHYVLFKGEVR